ncbi:hypothetical protein LCGC14_1477230, partial [marine sediment metagenome]
HIIPLLNKYKVTAYICGHSHNYERSELPGGVTQIISGGAGAPPHRKMTTAAQQNPYSKIFASELHFCLFEIADGTARVKVLTPQGLQAGGVKLAHLTGVDAVELTAEQWAAIHVWLLTGGTLIVDQAGGPRGDLEKSFDSAFRQAIERRYGPTALKKVSAGNELLTGLDKVGYRHFLGRRRASMPPRLESVKIGGRDAIIYSRYDMTCGLLGCPNPMVSGLTERGAYRVLARLVKRIAGP